MSLSRFSSKQLEEVPPLEDEKILKYRNYPLVADLLKYGPVRDRSFQTNNYDTFEYPTGDTGWLISLCVVRGRALHNVVIPFTLITLHSVVVVAVFENWPGFKDSVEESAGEWTTFYGLVLNVILSFLLVFRLNQTAFRYWHAREYWGLLLARGRTMTASLLAHADHNLVVRDEAIRWIAASAVSVLAHIRGCEKLPKNTLKGVLSDEGIKQLESAPHKALYTADRVRDAVQRIFAVTADTPLPLAHAWVAHHDRLEKELASFMDQFGAMERIRSTPLLLVYVTHLRTMLLIHLLLFPYVFGPTEGWATVPLTMVTAFAFLGIEGASMEVQNPFVKGVNKLNMDALAMALIQNIQQLAQTKADLEMNRAQQAEQIAKQQQEVKQSNTNCNGVQRKTEPQI